MAEGQDKVSPRTLDPLPELPFGERHWQAIFQTLRLSPRQIEIVTLMLRDASNEEIATELGISIGTLKSYWQRLSARIGVRSRMQLSMRVLVLSHTVAQELDGIQQDGIHLADN